QTHVSSGTSTGVCMTALREVAPHQTSTHTATFTDRHLGPRPADVPRMLAWVGADSLDALVDTAVPPSIRMADDLDLPPARTEAEVLDELRRIGARNTVLTSMIGQGYHGTFTPPVIRRHLLEN